MPICEASLHREILALDVAKFPKTIPKNRDALRSGGRRTCIHKGQFHGLCDRAARRLRVGIGQRRRTERRRSGQRHIERETESPDHYYRRAVLSARCPRRRQQTVIDRWTCYVVFEIAATRLENVRPLAEIYSVEPSNRRTTYDSILATREALLGSPQTGPRLASRRAQRVIAIGDGLEYLSAGILYGVADRTVLTSLRAAARLAIR